MTDLDTHLLAGPDLTDDEARERWSIDSDELAAWAIRKVDAAEKEQARIRQAVNAEIDRIQQWGRQAEAGPGHDIAFFTARLVEYRRRLEAADPKLPKTYKVATGSISVRAGRTSTKVTDPDAFIAWATVHAPDAIDHKPRVSALGDFPETEKDGHVVVIDPETGDFVPGVERVTADPTYAVKAAVIGSEF